MTTTRKPNLEPLTLTIPEVAALLDINLIAAYELARQTGFPAFKIGRRIIVPRDALNSWLRQSAENQTAFHGRVK